MEEYYNYAIRFELLYEELKAHCDVENVVDELCATRFYTDIRMKQTLLEMGIIHVDYFDKKTYNLTMEELEEFGLLSKSGNFLLEGGYIVPIRDIEGYILALVGWFPGRPTASKYITSRSKYFSKKTSLFNIDNAVKIGQFKFVFVVEGVFDCIAMRSIGLPCVSIQGSEMSNIKRIILKMFSKIVPIPDNDDIGKGEFVKWAVEGNVTYVELKGCIKIGDKLQVIKDTDDLIKYVDGIDEIMMEIMKSNEKLEKIEIS